MKKRFLTLFLALALCVGLCAVSAFAADKELPESYVEAFQDVSLTYPMGGGHMGGITSMAWQDMDWTMVEYEYDGDGGVHELTSAQSGYIAVRDGTVFTLSRAAAPAGDNTYVTAYLTRYVNAGGGRYEWSVWPHNLCLTPKGFIQDYVDSSVFGGIVELKAGESVRFDLPGLDESEDIIYQVKLVKWYPDFNYSFYVLYRFKVDEDCVDETIAEVPFKDVHMGDYFDLPVHWAVQNGITTGTSATAFSPYDNCTHAQILTFLWRAAGKPNSSAALPVDITGKNISYAETALRWAAEKGMVNSTLNPTAYCTRADAMRYIWTARGRHPAPASTFTDVPASAAYAPAVNWAVANGITNGTGGGNFSPSKVCNRGTIVTFLYRAYVPGAQLK